MAIAGLRLALDTGHCLVTGDIDPADAVRTYAPALGTVAIEDMRRGVHIHLPFSEGDMDMPRVLASLAANIAAMRLAARSMAAGRPRMFRACVSSASNNRANRLAAISSEIST